MKKRQILLSVILTVFVGLVFITCTFNSNVPSKIDVDKNLTVAVYSTERNNGPTEVSSSYLIEETVHVSELLQYPKEDWLTVPFNFTDTVKWAEITESYINKRIAISVDGHIVYTPVIKMKLENGACSVILNPKQTKELFPGINFEK